MEKILSSQDYGMYNEEDHATWSALTQRQSRLQKDRISQEYLEGVEKLRLDKARIILIGEVSKWLDGLSGWTLVPVTGLIPTRDFFYMLINKKYPVNVSIRRPWELDFSKDPDIFHDVFGHLPLLTNEKFTKFLTAYSIIALKYVNNERAVEYLGRLYWYTYEMGVILEDGVHKPYGGAIITSAEELANVADGRIPKHDFDIDQVFSTPYNPFALQKEYFVIRSFDELFHSLGSLEAKLMEHLLLFDQDNTLRNYPLNNHIGKEFNNVIGFLNDSQFKYPSAISFVAGQPDENFFAVEDHLSKFDVFVDYMVRQTGDSRRSLINKIGQYSKTKGIVGEILSRYLNVTENIPVDSNHILVTAGAQEAFAVILATICNREKDVVLVEDPSYIGLSSFAKIFDYPIEGVQINEEGIDLMALKRRIVEINRSSRKVKLLYVIPDYQNPTGSCMPVGNRVRLLELARQYNFLIIEDSVYNPFTYEQKKHPTLKSLDRYNNVIYVGSFSKSLFPGLRVGLIAADQQIENEQGETVLLVDEMMKVKAHLTNNTSTISQAILGGVLVDLNFDLNSLNKPKVTSYRDKRDRMSDALDEYIGVFKQGWARGIEWTVPDGGFFIKMSLPFPIDTGSVLECAEKFGVIFCPMRYFYLRKGGENEIRLTFSNLSPDSITQGVRQLAAFFQSKIAGNNKPLELNAEPAVVY